MACNECPTRTPAKEQPPIFDCFGPFADEMLMTSIDRILYMLGVNRMQKFLGCDDEEPCPCDEPPECCEPDDCEEEDPCPARRRERRVRICTDPSPVCACVKACSGALAPCLRNSFSLCSLACRRLKQKIGCPAISDKKYSCGPKPEQYCTCNPKWLWTRVRCAENGVKIYEVYKNSVAETNPHKMRNTSEKLIFIVMPNGCIMPFETVPCHN